jgi:hypothetical protein
MSRLILSLASGALVLGVAASASAQTSKPARQCFTRDQIGAVQPVGDKQLNVQVRQRDVYRIDLAIPCPGIRQPARIFDISPISSGASICSGADIRLGVIVSGGRNECVIDKITKLTPDEVKALPNRERP